MTERRRLAQIALDTEIQADRLALRLAANRGRPVIAVSADELYAMIEHLRRCAGVVRAAHSALVAVEENA